MHAYEAYQLPAHDAYEMHAYDAYEMHAYDAYEMHAYEMAYGRCTPMSWLLCERSHHLPRPHVTRALPISVKPWVFGGVNCPSPTKNATCSSSDYVRAHRKILIFPL